MAQLKFYVAGKWADRENISRIMDDLVKQGHTITWDWTRFETVSSDRNAECAYHDIEGVKECDIFVAIMTDKNYEYRGTFTELGAALALEKKVYVLGSSHNKCAESCFWHHPNIIHSTHFVCTKEFSIFYNFD